MRASGIRDVLVYCRDHRCSHHIAISADRWPDHTRLSDIEPGFVCTACGKRGAEVRPKFSQARMGKGQRRIDFSRGESCGATVSSVVTKIARSFSSGSAALLPWMPADLET